MTGAELFVCEAESLEAGDWGSVAKIRAELERRGACEPDRAFTPHERRAESCVPAAVAIGSTPTVPTLSSRTTAHSVSSRARASGVRSAGELRPIAHGVDETEKRYA
jgi:hypothetical protein